MTFIWILLLKETNSLTMKMRLLEEVHPLTQDKTINM